MTIPLAPYGNDTNGSTEHPAAPQTLLRRLDELEGQVKALTERVASLEGVQQPRDDLNRKILEFFRQYPGVKFTAHLIAENLGEDNSSVYTRLRTLARHGHVTEGKEDGRNRLFHVPAGN